MAGIFQVPFNPSTLQSGRGSNLSIHRHHLQRRRSCESNWQSSDAIQFAFCRLTPQSRYVITIILLPYMYHSPTHTQLDAIPRAALWLQSVSPLVIYSSLFLLTTGPLALNISLRIRSTHCQRSQKTDTRRPQIWSGYRSTWRCHP